MRRLTRYVVALVVLVLGVPLGALVYNTFFTSSPPANPCLHIRCTVLLDRNSNGSVYAKLSTRGFAALWLTWEERCPSGNIVDNLGITVSGAGVSWRRGWQTQATHDAGEAEISLNSARSVSVDVLPQEASLDGGFGPTCQVHTRLFGVPKRG